MAAPNSKAIAECSNWKKRNGFHESKGYFTEIVYLLRTLGIICDKTITQMDRENPLGVDGPVLSSLNPPMTIKVQELTVVGKELCDILQSGDRELFKITLFWIFLTHQARPQNTNFKPLMPIWQIVLSNPQTESDIRNVIKKFTADSYTVNSFRRWSEFFNLCSIIASKPTIVYFDRKKMSLKIFHAVIIDLNHNFVSKIGYNVDDIIRELEGRFGLRSPTVNYRRMLQVIFSNMPRDIVEGTHTGRGEMPLFEDRRINKLKILSKIPVSDFLEIGDSRLNSFLEVN